MEAILIYIDDWNSSKKIEMMDAHEERGYLRLLMRAAKEPDCGLPDDDGQLAIISKLGPQWNRVTKEPAFRVKANDGSYKTSAAKLRECFFVRDGRLYNERLLKEHAKFVANLEQKRSAAKKRWGKGDAEAHADKMRAHMRTHEQPDMRTDMREECGDPCGDDAASIQTYKPTNPKEKTLSSADAEFEQELERVSARITTRHPAPRSCSQNMAKKKLRAICKRVGKSERIGKLQQIDVTHEAKCKSFDWTKEGGIWAKSLENWLAPTLERYDEKVGQEGLFVAGGVRPEYSKPHPSTIL